jgi:hypothetical protein
VTLITRDRSLAMARRRCRLRWMAECSKDHVAAIGPLNSKLWFSSSRLIWRPGGALRWKVEQLVGKVGEWFVASWHLQGGSPLLCQLRIDELAPVSKY